MEVTRPTQTWNYCETHDVRFKTRTIASTEHFAGARHQDGSVCEVRSDQ